MTDEDYLQLQQQLELLIRIVYDMDLDGFVERINRAEALGPILNPTLFRAAGGKMERVKRLALALRPFQTEIRWQEREL